MDELLISTIDSNMKFKEWLINEAGDEGGSFFYGLQLYPSDAGDYMYAVSHPAELNFLQHRWVKERKQGRKFINIDEPEFQKVNYVTVRSETMPDAGPGFWKHKPDSRSNLKPMPYKHLESLAVGKNSKDLRVCHNVNPHEEIDVNAIFGDKGTDSVSQLSPTFDQPWTKVYENMLGYDVIGTGTSGMNNTGMGLRSKYVGPDDTGEKDADGPKKIADFGFTRRRKSKKYQGKHK